MKTVEINTVAQKWATQININSTPSEEGSVSLWTHDYPQDGSNRLNERNYSMSAEKIAEIAPEIYAQIRPLLGQLTEAIWEHYDTPVAEEATECEE